jgi:2-keto-4-pentenoate hydratase/2-oxohepta-3-ene-1,7-dioic acid hydratase in catechol pathway
MPCVETTPADPDSTLTSAKIELKCPIPKVPEVFFKPSQCINNPSDAVIIPSSAPEAIDAEVELAVVLGKDCKNADSASALDYVLGYTVANDITARDIQARVSQWGYAKGYDGFCPLGPTLVSAKAPGLDINNLKMKTVLDGQVLQDGTSAQMIFSVAEIITYLSRVSIAPPCY